MLLPVCDFSFQRLTGLLAPRAERGGNPKAGLP